MSFRQDQRPLVTLDWSLRGVHVTGDGATVTRHDSIGALLATLAEPHRIVAESTFESWDPVRRQHVIDAVRNAGHEIYVYRPIHTARQRDPACVKSDENDVRTIYQIATTGRTHIYAAVAPDPTWAEFRTQANLEYQRIRISGGKPQLVDEATEILGAYRELDDDARRVLGNGKGYSSSLLAATMFATRKCSSRAQFERLLGLHGSAYPSLLRSDVHHHSFRHARKRGVQWREFRRELRRTYARLKASRPGPYSSAPVAAR